MSTVIAKLRHLSGLTLDEAAEISGVGRKTIDTYEHQRTITAQNMEALLSVYISRMSREASRELLKGDS